MGGRVKRSYAGSSRTAGAAGGSRYRRLRVPTLQERRLRVMNEPAWCVTGWPDVTASVVTGRCPQRVCSPRCRIARWRQARVEATAATLADLQAEKHSPAPAGGRARAPGRGAEGSPPGAAASPVTPRPGSAPAGGGRAADRRGRGGTRAPRTHAPARPRSRTPGVWDPPRVPQKVFAVGRVNFRRAHPDILAKLLWIIPTFPRQGSQAGTPRVCPRFPCASSGFGQDPGWRVAVRSAA